MTVCLGLGNFSFIPSATFDRKREKTRFLGDYTIISKHQRFGLRPRLSAVGEVEGDGERGPLPLHHRAPLPLHHRVPHPRGVLAGIKERSKHQHCCSWGEMQFSLDEFGASGKLQLERNAALSLNEFGAEGKIGSAPVQSRGVK